MYTSVKIGGFGGQGVMVIGQMLGYAACSEGFNASFSPRYGPEKRGGTANCSVIIADREIGSLSPEKVDCLLALNQLSLDKFIDNVKPGGMVIINSAMCQRPQRTDVTVYGIDAVDIAREIGSPKVANIVVIGAFVHCSQLLDREEVSKALDIKLGKKPQFIEMNRRALAAGMEKVVQL